jgi:hypothetical protein
MTKKTHHKYKIFKYKSQIPNNTWSKRLAMSTPRSVEFDENVLVVGDDFGEVGVGEDDDVVLHHDPVILQLQRFGLLLGKNAMSQN